ncbi:MAG: hypothetical protein SangKO_057560 [Sandaracinaceae bacterium]
MASDPLETTPCSRPGASSTKGTFLRFRFFGSSRRRAIRLRVMAAEDTTKRSPTYPGSFRTRENHTRALGG